MGYIDYEKLFASGLGGEGDQQSLSQRLARGGKPLTDFRGPTNADRIQRGIAWLNAAAFRCLVAPAGSYTLPVTPLDPIIGNDKAFIGEPGSRFTTSASAGENGTFFRVGDGTSGSVNRFTMAGFELNTGNPTEALTHAIIVDGVAGMQLDLPYLNGVAGALLIGPNAYVHRFTFSLPNGSWRAERGLAAIKQVRATTVVANNVLLLSSSTEEVPETACALHIAAGDNNDGFYANRMEIWAVGELPRGVVLDCTGGQIVNFDFDNCVFDDSRDKAIELRADSGANSMERIYFRRTRTTPKSGQALHISKDASATGRFWDISADLTITAADSAVIETVGSLEDVRIRAAIRSSNTDLIPSLVKIGSSNVDLDIRTENIVGKAGYNHAVEFTADVDRISGTVKDKSAIVAPIDHFAYVNGWEYSDLQIAGKPAFKFFSSAVAVSHTGTTGETTLATVKVPGRSIGPNGVLRITSTWSHTNSANIKILRAKFGGTTFGSISATTTATFRMQQEIHNRNASNSQGGYGTGGTGGWSTTTGSPITAAIDTTADQNVVFSIELANAGETATLESYTIEVLRA
jgi:hypothetical protein